MGDTNVRMASKKAMLLLLGVSLRIVLLLVLINVARRARLA
jgi:hypothetical protein